MVRKIFIAFQAFRHTRSHPALLEPGGRVSLQGPFSAMFNSIQFLFGPSESESEARSIRNTLKNQSKRAQMLACNSSAPDLCGLALVLALAHTTEISKYCSGTATTRRGLAVRAFQILNAISLVF